MALRELLDQFMRGYPDREEQRRTYPKKTHPLHDICRRLVEELRSLPAIARLNTLEVEYSLGSGNWAQVPWIAIRDTRVSPSVQEGLYIVYLFAADMRCVNLALAQGVTKPTKEHGRQRAAELLRKRAEQWRADPDVGNSGFRLDNDMDLGPAGNLGAQYVQGTVAYKPYQKGALPSEASLVSDLTELVQIYERIVDRETDTTHHGAMNGSISGTLPPSSLSELATQLYRRISARGFYYPEAFIRAFCAALKAKPFVLLAGISGTGKTRLVRLVAREFGTEAVVIPVRPDWSDSSDLLGYRDLRGNFRPGRLLQVLREANENPERPYFVCLDEMNLARVEHYFAEFLSTIESREVHDGRITSAPVVGTLCDEDPWKDVYLSDNVFLIGTVNMDETTHPFSRKVLDRANTFEFTDVDLRYHGQPDSTGTTNAPLRPEDQQPLDWRPLRPQYCRLSDFYRVRPALFDKVIAELESINGILERGLFQVGYRVRDEACLFVMHALEAGLELETALDMQILQKILPRVYGSSTAVKQVLVGLWNKCTGANLSPDDLDIAGRTAEVPEGCEYPRSAAKIAVMLQRLESDGYTSYWV